MLISLIFFCVEAVPSNAYLANKHEQGSLERVIENRYEKLSIKQRQKAPPAPALAERLVLIRKMYNIKPDLMLAIMGHESAFNPKAYNKKTRDFGIMQINIKTAQAYEINKGCILDWECSLVAGAKILSDFKTRYSKKESEWYIRYNIGTTRNKMKINILGKKYATAINKQLVLINTM